MKQGAWVVLVVLALGLVFACESGTETQGGSGEDSIGADAQGGDVAIGVDAAAPDPQLGQTSGPGGPGGPGHGALVAEMGRFTAPTPASLRSVDLRPPPPR